MRKPVSTGFLVLFIAMLSLPASAAQGQAAATGPVKVFILAGQSNMEGKALAGTLQAVIDDDKTHEKFRHLKTGDTWSVRNDVWVTFLDKQIKGHSDIPLYGSLTVGFGGHKLARDDNNKRYPARTIGPELGFGYVVGDHYKEQVLLIKAAWGGKSVKRDFRPPSAMPTDEQLKQELAESQQKNPHLTLEELKGSYGRFYRKILEETHKVLGDIKNYFPAYNQATGYEIAGFVWFQGWNDGVGQGNPEYPEQMAHFIRDIRKDLKAPNLPFVIGQLGTDGPDAGGWIATFRKQQAEIAAVPEFKDDVRLAKTAQFWPKTPDLSRQWAEFREKAKANEEKPKDDPTRIDPGLFFRKNWVQRYRKQLAYTSDKRYHYLSSGACYYQMGEAMAKAMLDMVK